MASTNKTPQLGLNQWAAGDPVLREDFNGDNAKIEAGIEAAKMWGACVTGSYKGDQIDGRTIVLGIRPKFVILLSYGASGRVELGFSTSETTFYIAANQVTTFGAHTIHMVDTGFILVNRNFNELNATIYYAAIY